MKQLISALLLVVLCTTGTMAQTNNSDSILFVEQGFWGPAFSEGAKPIRTKEAIRKLKTDSAAYGHYLKASNSRVAAGGLGFVGGFMMGLGIIPFLSPGSKTSQSTAVIILGGGVVITVISYQFDKRARLEMYQALELYNRKFRSVRE